jgi:hypothetical protein
MRPLYSECGEAFDQMGWVGYVVAGWWVQMQGIHVGDDIADVVKDSFDHYSSGPAWMVQSSCFAYRS